MHHERWFCLCSLVLSWDGEVSAVSRDAVEDVRHAQTDTVIDEWDEDFDRGKVRNQDIQHTTHCVKPNQRILLL